jgi:broad specificity phosphatase PhoE
LKRFVVLSKITEVKTSQFLKQFLSKFHYFINCHRQLIFLFCLLCRRVEQIIWLLRHAERLDEVDPTWAKTASRPFDPPISEKGVKQAQQTAKYLKEKNFRIDRIISSPFLRCMQTAHEISLFFNKPICIEPGVCEWLKGSWFTAVPTFDYTHPSEAHHYTIDSEYQAFCRELHYPESFDQMMRRYQTTIEHLANQYSQNQILIVTHGYGVQFMVECLCPTAEPIYRMPYACLSKLVRVGTNWISAKIASDAHLI